MGQFNIAEAKARLSELIEKAVAGDDVVIARDNKPVAKLVPVGLVGRTRKPGSARGTIWMSDDFDAPLPDFKDYE